MGEENALNKKEMTKFAWAVVLIAWGVNFVVYLGNFALGVMLPGMRADLGFGVEAAGWLSASAWIFKAALTIPITLTISKFKPKDLLATVFGIASFGLLLQGLATNYTVLLIGRSLVQGISGAILAPLAAIKMGIIPKDRMAQVNGIENFTGPLGQTLGTALVPFLLVTLGGWRQVLTGFGILGVVLTIAWVFLFRGGKDEVSEDKSDETDYGVNPLTPLFEIMKHRAVWLLSFGWIGTSLVWIAIYTFWPTYAVDTIGLSLEQSGFVLGLLPIGSMVGSLTSPKIAEKIGYDKLMIWPWGFILPFAYFSLLKFSNIAALGLGSFIAGYGAYAFVPIAFTTIYKIPNVSPRAVALGIAMISTFSGVGGALGGSVAGILGESLGLYNAMAVCCLSPFLFGVLTLFLPEYGRKYQEEQARLKK